MLERQMVCLWCKFALFTISLRWCISHSSGSISISIAPSFFVCFVSELMVFFVSPIKVNTQRVVECQQLPHQNITISIKCSSAFWILWLWTQSNTVPRLLHCMGAPHLGIDNASELIVVYSLSKLSSFWILIANQMSWSNQMSWYQDMCCHIIIFTPNKPNLARHWIALHMCILFSAWPLYPRIQLIVVFYFWC